MLMSLGEAEAAEVFKHLSPKEVQKLGEAIALAAVSRVLIIVADLVTAASAAGLGWWERRRFGPIHHDRGVEDDEV